MGILDQKIKANGAATNPGVIRPGQTRRPNNSTPAERDQSQFWLNVGYTADDGRFVSLPYGLPMDNMADVRVSGQNEEWVALSHARNDLKAELLEAAGQLEPGQEVIVQLEVRLRRINTQMNVDAATNPYRRTSGPLIVPVEEPAEE